jgi:hypothetical protein
MRYFRAQLSFNRGGDTLSIRPVMRRPKDDFRTDPSTEAIVLAQAYTVGNE